MALDRTWYNTLIDDSGDNTSGTLWNKAAVDSLMDAIDASIDLTWTAVSYVAGNFTSPTGTWVVDSGDVLRNHYIVQNKLLIWQVWIATTTVTGTPSHLRIALPVGTVPTTVLFAAGQGNNAGAAAETTIVTPYSGTAMGIQRQSAANWTAATNTTAVQFTFVGALA
jgi:hypothetical protein